MADRNIEVAAFFMALSKWLDGMSVVIAISKNQMRDMPVGQHLLMQDLRKQTLRLKNQALELQAIYSSAQNASSQTLP